ncbi:MAG: primosomal protein N' [Nitrospirota bacterium]
MLRSGRAAQPVRTDRTPDPRSPEPATPDQIHPGRYAEVVVPRHLYRSFTYLIPDRLRGQVGVGSLVLVPFGPSRIQGVIVALPERLTGTVGAGGPSIGRLREILPPADGTSPTEVPPELLELTRLVADRYLAPWGQCLRLALPAISASSAAKSPRSRRRGAPARPADRTEEATTSQTTALPPVPEAWQDRLSAALASPRYATWLVQAPAGVRLACLMDLTGKTLDRDRSVLAITPEVSHAVMLAQLARARWGERVALLHGGLAPAQRNEAWERIRSGAVRVVIGTRSAVFAPLDSLGLLYVDREDDAALKEEQEPRYHAGGVARLRAEQHGAVLLLGSSHPSLEAMRLVASEARLTLDAESPSNVPNLQLIDLRRTPHGTLLTPPLIAAIRTALEARTGRLSVILFLNRKGFAPALLCRDCGAVPRCSRCSVALTLYRRSGRLACHSCGASQPIPDTCPACRAAQLDPIGFGTERLEEDLRRLFPTARIGRLDKDTARTQGQAEAIRRRAAGGELDVLIGTQMLFQGPPLPRVELVGLPHADAGLHLPDFRAAERTFHMLQEAVGLALPGQAGGQVLLQTYLPTHHAIAAVAGQQPGLFYEQESAFRQALGYPPFTHLISLHVSGKNPRLVQRAAEGWANRLRAAAPSRPPDEVTIMGPIPAPHAQLRGRHRWHLLVKSADAEAARRTVRVTLDQLESERTVRNVKFEVDVDPVEMG